MWKRKHEQGLTNVYDQSPPFPYCNCAKALAERARAQLRVRDKPEDRTNHSESVLRYVTATNEQVDGGGSGTEG